jgi:hypothetical protein
MVLLSIVRNKEVIDMEIAKTILSQIKALDKMAMCAWGAKDLVGMEDGLMFKSSGMVRNKGNVMIKLNGNDLYDVTFGKIRKYEYKELACVEDVFVENLVETVDKMVG